MRRRSLLAGALGGAFLISTSGALSACATVDTVGKVDFTRPLLIPLLAESRIDDAGRRVFNLHAQRGRRDFGVEGPTRTLGFNGDYLGPTLRARRGEHVMVNVVNDLTEKTSVHWHGMHLPARMDGGPHQPVRPGATWSPDWTVDQPAATLWYHPHPHGHTREHVNQGLAGLFILDDDDPAQRVLPHEYGVDDIPVIVQDKSLHKDEIRDHDSGDLLLVNGTYAPCLDVRTDRVRLRLLNASVSRTYAFGLADQRQIQLVATDGGLLPAPATVTTIRLSPGERAEVVVPMRATERTVLRSFPPAGGRGIDGGKDQFDVLELRAAGRLRSAGAVPATLGAMTRLDPANATVTREFRLSGTNINGDKMDLDRIDLVAEKGATEIWTVRNTDGQRHNFHVHDVQFQVLSVDGGRPPADLEGWKDTVFLPPKSEITLILRFADYADPTMPYMYHCHLLMHEDKGMMGQFVVVEPGQSAGPIGGVGGHEHR
ncbi:multicopper oxidase domain-containing protein [Asanoa sp. WMMD1127]|uniref:multicopper oxidase family protein n=1 Tax=Asanoa sp. WMMD1127 TaxID=3016107 RepID=UPI0024160ADF|nr:multicopper oxidase domain-containing protein [Asanoa sp. WMMD1127]MDG4821487.1 multicopper oxidase domain-containing protein [Asanoa sp. WMMD1127]